MYLSLTTYATLPPLKVLHTFFQFNHKTPMSRNDNGMPIVVKSISNTVNTISELDALIQSEKDEVHINQLKKRREQLIEVLKKLAQELDAEAEPFE